jgi:hypothetical protein
MLLGFSANMVVLFNGEVVEFPVPTEERVLEPDVITEATTIEASMLTIILPMSSISAYNTNYICII